MSTPIKSGAIAELKAEQAAAKRAFAAREYELSRHLISLIPKSLKGVWLEKVGILTVRSLVTHGEYTENYGQDGSDPVHYGFKSLEELHQAFEELRTAWAGIVNVRLEWRDKNHRRFLLVLLPAPIQEPV